MFKLDLEKAEEPEVKLLTSTGSLKRKCSGKPYCIDYAKAFDCVYHDKLWKILKEMGIPDHFNCFLRNLYAGQEARVRTRHGTMVWFQLGREYVKVEYCRPAYLIYMQSTSCEMPGWMNHKLESGFLEKYQQPQICRWYHSNGRKQRGPKEPLH